MQGNHYFTIPNPPLRNPEKLLNTVARWNRINAGFAGYWAMATGFSLRLTRQSLPDLRDAESVC
jgi:hypothetical protein